MPALPRGYWFDSFILHGWNTVKGYLFLRNRKGKPIDSIRINSSDDAPLIIPTPNGMLVLCDLMVAIDRDPDLRNATICAEELNTLVSERTQSTIMQDPLEVVNEFVVARCDYHSAGAFEIVIKGILNRLPTAVIITSQGPGRAPIRIRVMSPLRYRFRQMLRALPLRPSAGRHIH